mmetsp:Transcript_28521/g.85012  ORF Transcript_28521/g.85012 Transcript_28521/m.85012 type:complete len:107 (-) Transcript_28521:953-1273(-)
MPPLSAAAPPSAAAGRRLHPPFEPPCCMAPTASLLTDAAVRAAQHLPVLKPAARTLLRALPRLAGVALLPSDAAGWRHGTSPCDCIAWPEQPCSPWALLQASLRRL